MLHPESIRKLDTRLGYQAVEPKQRPPKPADIPVNAANLPPELAAGDRFIVWLWTWKEPARNAAGKWDKPPHSPAGGYQIDANDPRHGVSLEEAIAAAKRLGMSGVGRQLFLDDTFIAWDFDDCYDPETQTITDPDVAAFVAELGSYTEVTPSGTGIRVWGRGTVDSRKGIKREVYSSGRYITVTGLHVPGTPQTLNDIQAVSDRIIARIFPPKPSSKRQPTAAFHHETGPLTVDDETVLRRARLTHKFRDLEQGGGEDASAGDQSFCDALVGAGAVDPAQIDRIVRNSRRMRDKWDEKHYANGETYGQHTAAKAFDGFVQNRYANGEPVTLVTHERRTVTADDEPPECPEVAHWRTRALTAEARVADLELENAELRLENSTIISTSINPSVKAEAPTFIRTAIEVHTAKQRGEADERGFVRISTSKIGDDYPDRFDGLNGSIRSRSTVSRHLKKAADLGLIEREVRTVMAPRIVRDKDNKPVIDPDTKKPKTYEASTDQTWVKMTGESITDLLRPFAFFRAPETVDPETKQPKPKHGGDRRSPDFRATRTPCPDCGSTERKTYCVGCGCDVTEIAAADEQAAGINPIPAFQDAPYINRGTGNGFHLETEPSEPSPRDWQQGLAVYAGHHRQQAPFQHDQGVTL